MQTQRWIRTVITAWIVLATWTGAGLGDEPGNRFALLVGINAYEIGEPLRGCVNDVADMRGLLVSRYAFNDDDVRTLVDAEATRAGILDAFRSHLIENARLAHERGEEAVVVFHYSGHGALMPDHSGDESVFGTDGRDEALVPHDARDATGFIRDDELDVLFRELATFTTHVTCIIDACHSGTATKSIGPARSLGVFGDGNPATDVGTPEVAGPALPYALITAAHAHEKAWDFFSPEGTWHGTLTYHLARELANHPTGAATYRDIMDAVRLKVMAVRSKQTPGLAGAGADHLVFGMAAPPPEPHILVTSTGSLDAATTPGASDPWVVHAGAIFGLTPGSLLDVYPPGAASMSDPQDRIGTLEIVRVGATTSTATQVSGTDIPDASRAVIRAVEMSARPVRVYLDVAGTAHAHATNDIATLQAVQQHIEADAQLGGNVRFVDDILEANLVLSALNTGRLGITIGGVLASSTAPFDEPDRVVRQIRHWAQWMNLLQLENRAATLDVQLSVTDTGDGVSALADDGGLILQHGETIEIRVENRSRNPVFFGLVDLASDGSRVVVFPPAGQAERLGAKQSWSVTTTVFVPDDVETSFDYLKLIAFVTPVDLSGLHMDAAPKGLDDPSLFPLDSALLRHSKGVGRVPPQDWVTDVAKIYIVRE